MFIEALQNPDLELVTLDESGLKKTSDVEKDSYPAEIQDIIESALHAGTEASLTAASAGLAVTMGVDPAIAVAAAAQAAKKAAQVSEPCFQASAETSVSIVTWLWSFWG